MKPLAFTITLLVPAAACAAAGYWFGGVGWAVICALLGLVGTTMLVGWALSDVGAN
jgi:hypothetical protein